MALTAPWALHSHIPVSLANGPGRRFVIWVQGCTLACPGCFNPDTHSVQQPAATVGQLLDLVRAQPGIDGVTVSGGEPLQQPEALRDFLQGVKELTRLTSVVLTGYSRNEIEHHPEWLEAVSHADMVIAGRYNPDLHLGEGLRGSRNKEYWSITDRLAPEDFVTTPIIEVLIDHDGSITFTGMRAASGLIGIS